MTARGAFSALALLALSCGPSDVCPTPCPGATAQITTPLGLICWCGSKAMLLDDGLEAGPQCDWQTQVWAGISEHGCPRPGGGHAP